MKRLLPRLLLVAVFSASWTLAEAQAVARGGGGGGSSSSGSSSGSSGSSSSSGGGGSTTSSTSSSGSGSSYSPPPTPTHSYAPPRTPSHSGGGSGSNGGGSYSGSGGGSRTPGSSAGAAGRRVDGGSTNSATAPTYARPDGSYGYAIPRQRTGGGRPPVYIYSPYYSLYPWGFGFFGYGYGLNYFYDPFYYGGLGYPGYGMPYGYGGYPGGYGYYGGGAYGAPGGYDPGVDNTPTYESNEPAREQDGPTGELRIKVKPREAKVIVDGQVMGVVDDFDGMFQKLSLVEGHHRISLQLDGYEALSFDVVIMAGQTVNYKGELHKLADVLKR